MAQPLTSLLSAPAKSPAPHGGGLCSMETAAEKTGHPWHSGPKFGPARFRS